MREVMRELSDSESAVLESSNGRKGKRNDAGFVLDGVKKMKDRMSLTESLVQQAGASIRKGHE